MNEATGSARFHELLKEMGRLHDKKQQDYGSDEDCFANVRASTEWSMPAWVGGMVRATDKLRRLQTYARKGTLQNEGARDSFLDLAVYAIISLVLWEEENAATGRDVRGAGSAPKPGDVGYPPEWFPIDWPRRARWWSPAAPFPGDDTGTGITWTGTGTDAKIPGGNVAPPRASGDGS